MKNVPIISIVFFSLLNSCQNSSTNQALQISSLNLPYSQQEREDCKLPLGMEKLVTIRFPQMWKNRPINDRDPNFTPESVPSEDFPANFYFVSKYYTAFYDSLHANAGKSIASVPRTAMQIQPDFHKTDTTSLLSDTLCSKGNDLIILYKDKGKFNGLGYGENHAVVNYLSLVSVREGKISDVLTLYYEEKDAFVSNRRFFFIDERMTVHLFDFRIEESETFFLGEHSYSLDDNGKFRPVKNSK